MDEKEKKLREDLEFHLDTLRRNLEVVSMEDLKAKYAKPFKDLKDNICKTATAYTQYISLGGIRVKSRYGDEAVKYINEAIKDTPYLKRSPRPPLSDRTWMRSRHWQGSSVK